MTRYLKLTGIIAGSLTALTAAALALVYYLAAQSGTVPAPFYLRDSRVPGAFDRSKEWERKPLESHLRNPRARLLSGHRTGAETA